jgi:hypothetical protein
MPMHRTPHHRASLLLALLAALLQALAVPLAHARTAGPVGDICTAQGARPAPTGAPDLPGTLPDHDHCVLCLPLPAAGAPRVPPSFLGARGELELRARGEDPLVLAPRFALRAARAPPFPWSC